MIDEEMEEEENIVAKRVLDDGSKYDHTQDELDYIQFMQAD